MISKEDFVKYIHIFISSDKYLDHLYEYHVNIFDAEPFMYFRDAYVDMLCKLMDLPAGKKEFNVLEEYIYTSDGVFDEEEVKELYDKITKV